MDLRISFYRRYVDDAASLVSSREDAPQIVESISAQDPHNLLKWDIDFPDSDQDFIPFLDTQITIGGNGTLHHKFYLKMEKKEITLHAKSHHAEKTKVATIRKFYRTATQCSSTPELEEESKKNILFNLSY